MIPLIIGALINFVVFFVYAVITYKKKFDKFPKSISITVNAVPRWYFVYFLLSSMGAIMTMNYLIEPDGFLWTNIGALLLCGVAAFAPINNPKVLKAHMVCAFGGFGMMYAGFIIDFGNWPIVAIFGALTILSAYLARNKYWQLTLVECILIVGMFSNYLF